MSEGVERTLAIKITPKLDIEALTKQIQEAVTKAMATVALPEKKSKLAIEGDDTDDTRPKGEGKRKDKPTGKKQEGGDDIHTTDTGNEDGDGEPGKGDKIGKATAAVKTVGSLVKTGFNLAQQTFQGIFGIIQEIHNKVKQSSAFLSAVENMFNLAISLLLMPLGNALAEVILPATIDLVDSVLALWDKFDEFAGEGDLKGMISLIMKEGLKLVGEYFHNIGDIFRGTGDTLMESIGDLFNWLGNFLESGKMARLLNLLFGIFEKFTSNIEIWIPMIIGYQVAQLGAIIGGAAGGFIPGLGAVTAGIGAGVGFAGGYVAGDYLLNNADGGYYPQSSGGTAIRVAEQENEYVIPESKLNQMGGGNYVTNNFYGYTLEELKQTVREVLQEEVSNSQFRSGL